MFRSGPFFLFATAVLAGSVSLAQTTPSNAQQSPADPQQSKSPGSDKNQNDQKTQGGESSVLVINAAPAMVASPQIKPELRAVDLDKRAKLSEHTKMELIQLMHSEFAHVRKNFPLGDKSLVINPQGVVSPGDAAIFQQVQLHGMAAKVGDRIQITNLVFHDKSISFQINGGPRHKSKWYQHISIGMGPTDTPIDTAPDQPTGAAFTLQFDKRVPEMNAEELRKLLSPVLDFAVKTASQVYAETLPPKIREAVKNHEVLVGMNHDMVLVAKDRPQQKIRDKDENGKDYEEWVYGAPPQEMMFVRFVGDEVTQVKIAKIGAPVLVKTQKEVDVKDGVVTMAALKSSNTPQDVKPQDEQPQEQQGPKTRPTLRRPGEQDDTKLAPNGPVATPQSEPEWGTGGQQKPPDPPPTQQQKPPE